MIKEIRDILQGGVCLSDFTDKCKNDGACRKCEDEALEKLIAEHDAKVRADALSELLEKMHPCKNCPSYPNECNHTEYFEDCCRTEKTISWEDLRIFEEQLKEQKI